MLMFFFVNNDPLICFNQYITSLGLYGVSTLWMSCYYRSSIVFEWVHYYKSVDYVMDRPAVRDVLLWEISQHLICEFSTAQE